MAETNTCVFCGRNDDLELRRHQFSNDYLDCHQCKSGLCPDMVGAFLESRGSVSEQKKAEIRLLKGYTKDMDAWQDMRAEMNSPFWVPVQYAVMESPQQRAGHNNATSPPGDSCSRRLRRRLNSPRHTAAAIWNVSDEVQRACNEAADLFWDGKPSDGNTVLQGWFDKYGGTEHQSIFGMFPQNLAKKLISSPDNKLYRKIGAYTEYLVQQLSEMPYPPISSSDVVPATGNPTIAGKDNIWILDQSCREPCTSTPFGHTVRTKYLTWKLVKALNIKDVALAGLYYNKKSTVEDQFLKFLIEKEGKDSQGKPRFVPGTKVLTCFEGGWAMGPPFPEARDSALDSLRLGVPNLFIDLTCQMSGRFAQRSRSKKDWMDFLTQSVLDMVEEADRIFADDMDLTEAPQREDYFKPSLGSIGINFVDLMEFLNLKADGDPDADAMQAFEKMVNTWKQNPSFQKRVVAVLTEEGRGLATKEDYVKATEILRNSFPFGEFRLAIHAHAGDANQQDTVAIECFGCLRGKGSDGVWAALIPHAAQGGHNSWFIFLNTLALNGNLSAWKHFNLPFALTAAKAMFFLNFNTTRIPSDCPMWGQRVRTLLNSAFATDAHGPEPWRKTVKYQCQFPSAVQRNLDFLMDAARNVENQQSFENSSYSSLIRTPNNSDDRFRISEDNHQFRISPLVSDPKIVWKRIAELGLVPCSVGATSEDHICVLMDMFHALMEADVRVNMDSPTVLEDLWREALALPISVQSGTSDSMDRAKH